MAQYLVLLLVFSLNTNSFFSDFSLWQPWAVASDSQEMPRDELDFWHTSFSRGGQQVTNAGHLYRGYKEYSSLWHWAMWHPTVVRPGDNWAWTADVFPLLPLARFSHWCYHTLPTCFYSNFLFSENKEKKRSFYWHWFTIQCRNSLEVLLQQLQK